MNGHALAQRIISDGGGPGIVCFALLVFSGLLRPLAQAASELAERRRPAKPPPNVSPDRAVPSPIALNAIELALIAELSLERAREQDAVANDPRERLATRQAASEAASAWRERARILQLESRRRTAQPIVPGFPPLKMTYTGPERRTNMRRRQTRRGRPEASSHGSGSSDRRTGPERRQRDRRRPELAPR